MNKSGIDIIQEQFVTKKDFDNLVTYVEDIAKKMNRVYDEVRKSKTIKINKLNEIFGIQDNNVKNKDDNGNK